MRQLLQPIAAFVYCNRQAPQASPGRRRQARDWTRPWTPPILWNYFISFHDGTMREI